MNFIPETSDLLNDNGLDEMQKTYAYKLAFKYFKVLYWSNTVFCFMPFVFKSMTNQSSFYAITSLMLLMVTNIIYLLFGAEASKGGALNLSFAKHMANPVTIAVYVIMFILYTTLALIKYLKTGEIYFIFIGIFTAIMIASHIVLGYIAKKNNKVLEGTEDE